MRVLKSELKNAAELNSVLKMYTEWNWQRCHDESVLMPLSRMIGSCYCGVDSWQTFELGVWDDGLAAMVCGSNVDVRESCRKEPTGPVDRNNNLAKANDHNVEMQSAHQQAGSGAESAESVHAGGK